MRRIFSSTGGMLFVMLAVVTLGISLSLILFYEPGAPDAKQSALPPFSMPVLESDQQVAALIDNQQLKLPALFNVWASWCVSCRYEHPLLMELKNQGVRIYGINYQDVVADAQEWLKHNGDPYVLSIKDTRGVLGARLGVYGVPETYLVNANGVILKRQIGVLTERAWQEKFLPIWQAQTQGNE